MFVLCARYFIYFIIYSILGWIMEVLLTSYTNKKFVNRGFLIGPYLPIYGWGSVFIILIIGNKTDDILSVFLKAILICSLLEYFTSYCMERLFKARWWDYSNKKFNINGRVCLETMIPFGVIGCLLIYFLHPFISYFVIKLNDNLVIILAIILLLIYLTDNILSFKVMSKIKLTIKNERNDNTEQITEKVRSWILNNSLLYRRIQNAFPKFKIYNKRKD